MSVSADIQKGAGVLLLLRKRLSYIHDRSPPMFELTNDAAKIQRFMETAKKKTKKL